MRTLVERFEAKYVPEPNSGCWLWTAGVNYQGYGKFSVNRESRPAHRVSWNVFRGEVPSGLQVLHRCDVTGCVNPDHLFLGTPQDNMTDKKVKGRCRNPVGSECSYSRLTEDDIIAIRQEVGTQDTIAKRYGIAQTLVSMIKLKKRWKHVQ